MAFPSESPILITGASGFTGRRLSAALEAEGRTVVGLSHGDDAPGALSLDLAADPGVVAAMADLQPSAVIHLAGISFAAHPEPVKVYEANVIGTARLLDALARLPRPPSTVIVASSATVYAPPDGGPIGEDHALTPQNHYGWSKLCVETVCRGWSDRLSIQVVRPFNYTGIGQASNFLIPKIVDHFARDTGQIRLGNLDLWRDISALDDVVEAYRRLLRQAATAGPVNLCSGEGVHLGNLLDRLREISGRDMEVVVDPGLVRANEPARIVGDRTRLDSLIGVWRRQSLDELLQGMYRHALSAYQAGP